STDLLSEQLRNLAIKLLDTINVPLAGAPYELAVGTDVRAGVTDERGFLFESNLPVPSRCILRWTYPDDPEDSDEDDAGFLFEREIILDYKDPDDTDRNEGARRRLHNLG